MLTGSGIDIVRVNRIRKIKNKWGEKFLKRIYTLKEQKYCLQKGDPIPHLAARFAAKEAVVKMLGVGMNNIKWKDIEIKNTAQGKPRVRIYGEALNIAQKNEVENIHISISHEKEYAVAQAIGESL